MKDHGWVKIRQVREYKPPYSLSGTACQALPALFDWQCPRCGVRTVAKDDGFGRPAFSLKLSCDDTLLLLIHEE